MHSKMGSILKRWHTLTASPKRAKIKWQGQYWKEIDGLRDIACVRCRSFDKNKNDCQIAFGTPLRKCVVSSIEAHINDAANQNVLELGFGRFSLGKKLVQRAGGVWTGIEPHQPKNRKPVMGQGGYGSASDIPFSDQSFDMVFGVQTFEHWGQKLSGAPVDISTYSKCINEIHRVLKPGGKLYLDAPVHFHGNEMFIMGDTDKIASHFSSDQWKNIIMERWRHDYQPLERYASYPKLYSEWDVEIENYDAEQVEKIKDQPIWLFVITAEKK